jgi:hypothetical protein
VAASGVLQVTRIVDGQVEAARVESRNLESADPGGPETRGADAPSRAAASRIARAAGAPEFNPEAGIDGAVNAWTPFMSNDGRRLRVCSTLEPVYELKGFSRIGFRMIRRVIEIRTGEELTPHQVSLLSTADQLKVDMATILRGIDRLRADGLAEQQLTLIVPISFTSLSTQRGRAELIAPLKEASGLVKLGVICEICGIEGVPLKALVSATSLVKPFSLLVVARLGLPAPHTINPLREAGLQAISFECPAGLEEAQFLGWSSAAIRASKAVARSVLVYGATSTARAGALASLGASHVSMAAA